MQWISVNERMPGWLESVIAWAEFDDGEKHAVQAFWSRVQSRWLFEANDKEQITVTHWMPMPEGPKGSTV